jgi:Fic family protein
MNGGSNRRNTTALEPSIVTDPTALAEVEVRNGLEQYDVGIAAAQDAIERGSFKLRPSFIQSLHREALKEITAYAGVFRPGPVAIGESAHQPPEAFRVPELVENLCDYVNEHWSEATPLHLGAYVMWRLNWIHPFSDGNGRTSRISSYVVMTIKAGVILPGAPTIPDQIVNNRTPYFEALEAADRAAAEGRTDVSVMEDLLGRLLARQLTEFYKSAGGALPDDAAIT